MADERILIIDDKIEIINFLLDLLRPLGYRVSFAMGGAEGLALVREQVPDLILLDLNMPGTTGLEVLESLRREDFEVPVILMTLYGSESILVRALRLGVRDYVAKPFNITELLAAIERALQTGRLQRERERLMDELQQANKTLSRHMQGLSTLQAIGRSVASLMPREQLLRRVLDAALYLASAQVGALFVVDEDDGLLYLEAVRQGDSYAFDLRRAVPGSHAEEALYSSRTLTITAPQKPTGLTGYLGQGEGSLCYVPICSDRDTMGVLAVAWLGASLSSAEVQSRLSTLADYAAIALRNAQLFKDRQRQAENLATVNHIATTIVSSLDPQEIMATVVRDVKETLNAENASLVLRDKDNNLTFEVSIGGRDEKKLPLRLGWGQGIAGWVVEHGRPLRVDDVSTDPRFQPTIDRLTGIATRSVLCVPLSVSGRVIGAVEAINKRDGRLFTPQDQDLLQGVAAFVAMAIENARLHVAMRRQVAAETLQETVVAVCHHVNNPLQTLIVTADLLQGKLQPGEDQTWTLAEIPDLIEKKVKEIAAVLSVLQQVSEPQSTSYVGSLNMLDIENELQAILAADDT